MSSRIFMLALLASSGCVIEQIEDALEYQHAYRCTVTVTWTCGDREVVSRADRTWCAYDNEEARAWDEHVCRQNVETMATETCASATCATTCVQASEFCYE